MSAFSVFSTTLETDVSEFGNTVTHLELPCFVSQLQITQEPGIESLESDTGSAPCEMF